MSSPTGADPLRELLMARLGAQYRIESLLGRGGMGSVYLARDLTLDRPVAIKVIGGDVTTNTQLRERFLLEARTVARLRHPNLVAVYSAGDADGLLYFVMEFVPGESLRDLLTREGKVERTRAERILHELALALDYAHANGIVHRDVKPENILLDGDTGRAMLTDFGVARALEGDGRMTGTGMILGSPRYMSPEQAAGESTLDGRSDLYSLALVGYEMFTGRPVVESANVAGMLVKHLTETPKPLADEVSDVPEGAATAIDRALAKDRDARWANGREMAEVIGMAWTPSDITTGPGTRTTRKTTSPLQRRARTLRFGVAGIVLAALAAFGAWALNRDRTDPRRSYAVVPFDIQTGNADVQWLRDGAVNMLTLALGQWRDLTVADYERTLSLVREEGLEDRRVDLAQARRIADKSGAGTVVMGLVTTTADSLHVQATLYDVKSGEALPNRTTLSTALGADPRPLFDDLARFLLDAAGGSPSASVELARATTTSLQAYRSYLDGVRLLNSWQLREADSAFRVAIREDSTFALAWHKRSLALGWGDAGSDDYLRVAEKAAELSERLPAREQALVRGHHRLTVALRSQLQGDSSTRAGYEEAKDIFRDLLATDSMVAEAWYGLGDAYFHDQAPGDSLPRVMDRFSNSLRAFHRTLALDSTFHLAYSHLLSIYQGFSSPQSQLVIDGDSVVFVGSEETVRALGGPSAVAAMRERAARHGLALARGWVRADADAVAPHITLARLVAASGSIDSAVAVLDRALERPAVQDPSLKLMAAAFQLLASDPRAYDTMHEATTAHSVEDFRRLPTNEGISVVATALTVAMASGNAGEANRLTDFFARVDSLFAFSNTPTRTMLRWYTTAGELAMGAPMTPERRRVIVAGIRANDAVEGSAGLSVRAASGAVPFIAYMATRDTMFSNAVRRWGQASTRHTDLDALEALHRGDTATARTIAAAYQPADSLRDARFSFGGLRTIARAEVLLALGDTTAALAYYGQIEPERITVNFIEPGIAAYVRTFAARARIHEDRGETAEAIAAWEEFVRRFEHGDELVEGELTEARRALARLRDTAR